MLPAGVFAESTMTGKKVFFFTSDGVKIVGYYRPAKPGKGTLVMLHGLGSTKEEWQAFVAEAARRGLGFFCYDARGHGESVQLKSGNTLSYRDFNPPGFDSDWEKMAADLGEVLRFLDIAPERTGLVGASLGANVCIAYAAGHKEIPLVVLLSPGIEYAGYNVREAVRLLRGRSVLFAASPQDTYAYQSSTFLYHRLQPDNQSTLVYGAKGHGVQMFDGKLENKMLNFVEKAW